MADTPISPRTSSLTGNDQTDEPRIRNPSDLFQRLNTGEDERDDRGDDDEYGCTRSMKGHRVEGDRDGEQTGSGNDGHVCAIDVG